MQHIKHIPLLLCLLLCACSSAPTTPSPPSLFNNVKDPTDAQLIDTIAKYTVRSGAPAASGFKYIRADLNGDKRREGLVLLNAPYGYWCGDHGCTMLVFKANNNGFTLVNKISPIRAPVYISNVEKTRGWKTLITRVSGRAAKAKNVALRFNGRTYPSTPENLPAHDVTMGLNPNYTRAFYD